jgi:hypothetical protein
MQTGHFVVLLGEVQKALDRLVEGPSVRFSDTSLFGTEPLVRPRIGAGTMCTVASALRTAVDGDCPDVLMQTARAMLCAFLDAARATNDERAVAEFAFQPSLLDPLAVLRGLVEPNGARERELEMVREAIVACTDAAFEANVPLAAEEMLAVLENTEYQMSDGSVANICDVGSAGDFMFFIWHRVARFAHDPSQRPSRHVFYLFNGATFERGMGGAFKHASKTHMRRVAERLVAYPTLRSRAEKLLARVMCGVLAGWCDRDECDSDDEGDEGDEDRCRYAKESFVGRMTLHALDKMHDSSSLRSLGMLGTEEFHDELDKGAYIGFDDGVYDVHADRFMPKGRVPLSVLVSRSTNRDYIGPDEPGYAPLRADIDEYVRLQWPWIEQTLAQQRPEERLRRYVESKYTHVDEYGAGTALDALFRAYQAALPRVHAKPLGKVLFARMLRDLYPGIGPHVGPRGAVYLLKAVPSTG